MFLVCTNCQEELAKVDVLFAFGASVSCGKCGATFGQRFVPEPAPAEPAPAPDPVPDATGTP